MTRDELLDRLHDAVSQMEDEQLEMFVINVEALAAAGETLQGMQQQATPNSGLSSRGIPIPNTQYQAGKKK